MRPKYQNLRIARTELEGYLNGLGKYHPTRSFIERALKDIEKAISVDPTTKACTPPKGYVEAKLKETGKYDEIPEIDYGHQMNPWVQPKYEKKL